MATFTLQSPWLAPARFFWRALRRFGPVRVAIERCLLYPSLAHVQRKTNYPDGPMLLAGFFSSAHGIGETARRQLAALRDAGHEVYGIDIGSPFGLTDLPAMPELCTLASAPAHGPLVLYCNAPETGRALKYLGPRLTENRRIIGYWAWELEVMPQDWERAYPYLDELWLLSRHTAVAFENAPVPTRVVPPVVVDIPDGGHSRADLGLPSSCESACLFLCMADCRSDLKRKNIYGAVRAFGKALGNKTKTALAVKLHHTEYGGEELQKIFCISHEYSNIYVLDRLYSQEERNSLLHQCDVLLSLHRAEGFGLPLAEALHIGKQVIATAYGGNMDFLTEENSTLIPYKKIPVQGVTINYAPYAQAFWAEPDEGAAVKALLSAAETVEQTRLHIALSRGRI